MTFKKQLLYKEVLSKIHTGLVVALPSLPFNHVKAQAPLVLWFTVNVPSWDVPPIHCAQLRAGKILFTVHM